MARVGRFYFAATGEVERLPRHAHAELRAVADEGVIRLADWLGGQGENVDAGLKVRPRLDPRDVGHAAGDRRLRDCSRRTTYHEDHEEPHEDHEVTLGFDQVSFSSFVVRFVAFVVNGYPFRSRFTSSQLTTFHHAPR
jgi:hypothetical protein